MGFFDRFTERVGDFLDEVMIPDELRVQLERADQARRQGDFDEALRMLDRVDRLRPDLQRVAYLRGLCHLDRGAPAEAARAFRQGLAVREDALTHFYAGLALEQIGQWRDAQQHIRRAMALEPRAPFLFDMHLALGRIGLELDRADRAARELRKALRIEPGHPEAAVALAEALVKRGQHEAAREALELASEPTPRGALIAGRIAAALDEPSRALAAYSDALDRGVSGLFAYQEATQGAARAALELGDHMQAHTLLLRALDDAPSAMRADIFVLLGEVHEHIQNDEKALESFESAIRQRAGHGGALRGAGRIALRLGHPREASEYFRRALDAETQRDQQDALLGLGLSRLELGDFAGAHKLLEDAIKSDANGDAARPLRDNPDVLHALGRVALAGGDAADALVSLREAALVARDDRQRDAIDADMHRALERLRPAWTLPGSVDDALGLSTVLHALRDYIATDPRLVDFMPATQKMLRDLDAPLSIAIVGEFNAGKSTLINTLIGEDIVPMGVLPTTAHTGIIQYGPRQAARVVYRDESVQEVTFKEARRQMKTNADDIDHLDYLYPHPELRVVNFWDTPGFNALDDRHEQVAAHALEHAEAILWVLDANQVLSQTEFERIETIPGGAERLLVVINKIDRLGGPDEREELVEELIEYVEENAGDHIAGCYPVSALQAKRERAAYAEAGESWPPTTGDQTGFDDFQRHLQEKLIQRAGRIKAIEGKRHLMRLVITLAAFQRGLTQRYRSLLHIVRQLRAWLAESHERRPRSLAREELMQLEDRHEVLLRTLTEELGDAMKPRGGFGNLIGSGQVLADEDREYLLEILGERFRSLLDRSQARVFNDVSELEASIAQRVGPILRSLSLQDARSINRRLEGFYDEIRVMRLLLSERVYGRLAARATGQLEAAGHATLADLQNTRDEARWKAALRRLLPDLRAHVERDLVDWYDTFFAAADRFCDRLERDLSLLELEARYRYDINELEDLVLGGDAIAALDPGEDADPPTDAPGEEDPSEAPA